MHIKKEDIKPYQTDMVSVFEYGGLDNQMDLGVAEIRGIYPAEGKWSRNLGVETMTYFVVSGSGRFCFDGETPFEIKVDDCVFIAKNRGYQVVVPEGVILKVIMASNPRWSPEQYEVYSKHGDLAEDKPKEDTI